MGHVSHSASLLTAIDDVEHTRAPSKRFVSFSGQVLKVGIVLREDTAL